MKIKLYLDDRFKIYLLDGLYYPEDKRILDILNSSINNIKRVEHSLNVATLAYKIALSNHFLNPIKFYIAGLVHDIAKNLDKDTFNSILDNYYKEQRNDIPEYSYHAFCAPIHLKELFDYEIDEDFDNALRYHCTGRSNMSILEKTIYLADEIEPTRDYDSSVLINIALNDLERGFIEGLIHYKEYLKNRAQMPNNKYSEECFKYYLKGE